MRRSSLPLLLAAIAVGASACTTVQPVIVGSPRAQAAHGEAVQLLRWLECEECPNEEAVGLRELDRELVLSTLKAALLEGPSEARLARYRDQLTLLHLQARVEPGAVPLAQRAPEGKLSEERRFVEVYQGNLRALYQKRAIVGLALLDDPDADGILRAALTSVGGFRRDVAEELEWWVLEKRLVSGA